MSHALAYVEVTPNESRAIQYLAFEHGYKWGRTEAELKYLTASFLHFWSDGSICYSSGIISSTEGQKLSFTDCVLWLLGKKELEESIRIGEHLVKFQEDGIKVGCTHVSKETVERIYKKLFPAD